MNKKRIFAIALIVLGAVSFCFSEYIAARVQEGQQQIDSAQRQVNQGKQLFSLSPYTKPIGDSATRGAQRRIDAGRQEVAAYADLSNKLKIAGIVLAIGGIAILTIRRPKKV